MTAVNEKAGVRKMAEAQMLLSTCVRDQASPRCGKASRSDERRACHPLVGNQPEAVQLKLCRAGRKLSVTYYKLGAPEKRPASTLSDHLPGFAGAGCFVTREFYENSS